MASKPKLRYKPRWTPELEGYSYNAIRHYWPTMQAWHEWDDLMQEARVVFLVCAKRYARTVDNPAWFMALFKTALTRRLIDLASSNPKYSLFEGLENVTTGPTVAPNTIADLISAIEKLPIGLRVTLSELCRPQRRLKVSRRSVAALQLALR